jgi:hypothetical protein
MRRRRTTAHVGPKDRILGSRLGQKEFPSPWIASERKFQGKKPKSFVHLLLEK